MKVERFIRSNQGVSFFLSSFSFFLDRKEKLRSKYCVLRGLFFLSIPEKRKRINKYIIQELRVDVDVRLAIVKDARQKE